MTQLIRNSGTVLLSVKPTFARALMSGQKTAELRRRFPDHLAGHEMYLYSSSPDRLLLGTVRITSIAQLEPHEVWSTAGDRLLLDEDSLDRYLENAASSFVISVVEPRPLQRLLSLDELRDGVGVHPPQSFRYLSDHHVQAIERLSSS